MHTCPECYLDCHCCGDIDDINFGEWAGCKHYKECESDSDYWEPEDYAEGEDA